MGQKQGMAITMEGTAILKEPARKRVGIDIDGTLAQFHEAFHRDYVLRPQRLGLVQKLLIAVGAKHQLSDTVAIAQVQKDATAQQRYAIRLSKEFPNSDQAHALAASKIDPG